MTVYKSGLFYKMRDLNASNSRIDMHTHTTWTDGKNTLADMAAQAEHNQLTAFAVTDHIRHSSAYYPDYFKEIENVRGRHRLQIYAGFEAKIKNLEGEIDISDEAAGLADLVIASVHRLPYGGAHRLPGDIPFGELTVLERDLSLAAVKRAEKITVLGHCGGMSIAAYGRFPLQYFECIISACAKAGIAFEYNYKYHLNFEAEIKRLLYKYNPYVSVGSDAHEAGRVANRSFCNGKK